MRKDFEKKNSPPPPHERGRDGVGLGKNRGDKGHVPDVRFCTFRTVPEVLLELFSGDSLQLPTAGRKARQDIFLVWEILTENQPPAVINQISGIGQELLLPCLHFLRRRIDVESEVFVQIVAFRIHNTEGYEAVRRHLFNVPDNRTGNMYLLGRHGGTTIRREGLSGENLNALPDKERQPAKPAGNRPSCLSADFEDGEVHQGPFSTMLGGLLLVSIQDGLGGTDDRALRIAVTRIE